MKKLLSLLLVIIMAATMFTACGNDAEKSAENQGEKMEEKSEEKSEEKMEEKSGEKSEEKSEEVPADSVAMAPKRVVAGTVAVAEMLDKLGFDAVVGVPKSMYAMPDRYKDLPDIGQPMQPDIEKVTSLTPDLFISVSSLKEANEKKLEEQGISSMFVSLDSYESVLDSIVQLGKALGKEAEAEAFVSETRIKADEIIKKTESKESPKVLFLFGSPKSIMVGTKESFTGSLMQALNVHNIADDLGLQGGFVPLNLENVVAANPGIILRLTHANPEDSKKMMDEEFAKNAIWKDMDAVKNGKVYDLDINIFSVSGNVKLVEALETLSNIVFN